jgi:MFS family permease
VGTLVYTKRTLVILCLWLLWGDFCFTLMTSIVPTIMPLKFKELEASNTVIGLFITTIPGVINMIFSPIVSFKSDRFRSRWGRRIPFILVTLPFLVASLFGLAFSETIGAWLHLGFDNLLRDISVNTLTIEVMGFMVVLFSFFNTFVNSVFWYLFNDVVPEELLARFMSWFRLVGLGASSLYNLFLFKHAVDHTELIFVSVGLLYLVGFGLMCLKVKEGKYPPPPPYIGGETGAIAAIKTYGKECLGASHYWMLFLASMGVRAFYVTIVFNVFLYQSLGLSLESAGIIFFAYRISSAVAIPISGWLADRFHPIRVVIAGAILQTVVTPLSLIWLFWHPSSQVAFYVVLAMNILLLGPIEALVSVMDPPLFMRIFPRDRFGQFCSANGMLRSFADIAAGLMVGVFLDAIAARWSMDVAYRCLPFWNLAAYGLVLYAMAKLYRSWKKHGGDQAYVPPVPGEKSELPASLQTSVAV